MFQRRIFYHQSGFVSNSPVSSKCWNRLGWMLITAYHCPK